MSLGSWWHDKVAILGQQSDSTTIRLAESRFLLLDIDVTGLEIGRDRPKGIATLPFREGTFRIADIVYFDLTAAEHGGESGGIVLQEAHRDLVDTMAGQTVVTYNPRFVRHMISQTASFGGLAQGGDRWIDLRTLLIGVFGTDMGDMPSMKRWQHRLNIDEVSEHSAICDVASMAQLLQVVLAYCEDLGFVTLEQLMEAKTNEKSLGVE